MKAVWKGAVLAESNATRLLEGNHYFPPDSLVPGRLRPSDTRTVCSWKGEASYFHVQVEGADNRDAAWTYATPKPAARDIAGYLAFWNGVQVED